MDRWMLRMARWVRHPPSPARIKLVLAIIALGLLIVGLEKAGLWPEWATAQRPRR
jgi:predicted acyltransferase